MKEFPTGGARLRVLPGPQDDFFDVSAFDILQRTRFVISPQSNRMAYRLAGASVYRASEREILSTLEIGAVDHVAKPFSVPVLMQRVRRLLGQ